ncbi:hypothetical protein D1AOALGA4SA_11373 [Olavius algarvensis Delta 1 endosymbiont]|nr:hypothetical protein D1AOALGA4SA_11373 [Olavius algarvensis Delta 1 endosymbiont]
MDFLNIQLDWDDFYWHGDFVGPLFDNIPSKGIQLHVGAKDEEEVPPHSLQVEAWQRLIDTPKEYSEIILHGLFEYYTKMRPKYVQASGEWAKNMPELTASNEIAGLIQLNIVDIGWPYAEAVEVGYSFRCHWDREHGAGIVLKGHKIVDVGGADCLYFSR